MTLSLASRQVLTTISPNHLPLKSYRRASVRCYDALVLRIRQELDRDARNALLRDLQRIVMADTPWILTFYPTLFEAMAPNIEGWVSHPDDHERWADLRERR